jgi:hypothetical protein
MDQCWGVVGLRLICNVPRLSVREVGEPDFVDVWDRKKYEWEENCGLEHKCMDRCG